jgi:hypothetical protein
VKHGKVDKIWIRSRCGNRRSVVEIRHASNTVRALLRWEEIKRFMALARTVRKIPGSRTEEMAWHLLKAKRFDKSVQLF